jgi:hypothetical protein
MAVNPTLAFSNTYVKDLTRIAHKIERQIDTIIGCDNAHDKFPILIESSSIEDFNYYIFEMMVKPLYMREGWIIGVQQGESKGLNIFILMFSWFPPLQVAKKGSKVKLGVFNGE